MNESIESKRNYLFNISYSEWRAQFHLTIVHEWIRSGNECSHQNYKKNWTIIPSTTRDYIIKYMRWEFKQNIHSMTLFTCSNHSRDYREHTNNPKVSCDICKISSLCKLIGSVKLIESSIDHNLQKKPNRIQHNPPQTQVQYHAKAEKKKLQNHYIITNQSSEWSTSEKQALKNIIQTPPIQMIK